jgi:hypothetical protein
MGRLRVTRAMMGRGVGYPEEISGPEKGDRKRACGGDPSLLIMLFEAPDASSSGTPIKHGGTPHLCFAGFPER